MSGSATITGRQNYVMGIGHPATEATTESPPAMLSTDSTGKANGIVGADGSEVLTAMGLRGGVFNVTASSFRNFRFGIGKADAPNQGCVHIAWFGDSIGLRAGGNNSYTIADRIQSLFQRDLLTYNGQAMPVKPLWFPATPAGFATVETLTGTWTNSNIGPLGSFGYTSTVNTSKIQWAAGATTNACRVHYLQQPGGGGFVVATTSNGSFTSQSTAGTKLAKYVDFAGGDGGISLTVDGVGPVTILGFERIVRVAGSTVFSPIRFDGSIGAKVSRFSTSGYKMADLAADGDTSTSLGYICDYLTPHLAIIGLMSNDGYFQTSIAIYAAQAKAVATRMKAAGIDVLFVGCPPYNGDSGKTIKLASYVDAIKTVCSQLDCGYLDIPAMWGDWGTSNAAGLMTDDQHPSPAGITLESQQIYRALQFALNC